MRTQLLNTRTALVATALLWLGGCSAAISQIDLEATHTEARVKTALINDDLIGTRVINVRVRGRIVELSGRVASATEVERAIAVARAVPGVTTVESQLRIGAESPEPPVPVEAGRADPRRDVAYEFGELDAEPRLLALGAAVSLANQSGRDGGTRAALSPLVRLGSRSGLGPAIAFSWFDATPVAPAGDGDVGQVRIRPLMGGIRYTFQLGRLSVSPSVVGGYAFNSIRVAEGGPAEDLSVDVSNSAAWQPGIAFWIESGHRIAIHLSLNRVYTSPRVTVIDNGLLHARTLNADTTVFLIGLAYKAF